MENELCTITMNEDKIRKIKNKFKKKNKNKKC